MCEFELPDVSLRCFVARQLLLRIYALSSVKFSGLKLWLCKKCDKYEVCIQPNLFTNVHLINSMTRPHQYLNSQHSNLFCMFLFPKAFCHFKQSSHYTWWNIDLLQCNIFGEVAKTPQIWAIFAAGMVCTVIMDSAAVGADKLEFVETE